MKKTLTALVLLAASGTASALSWPFSGDDAAALLEHIPADSPYFAGYSEPYDAPAYFAHWRNRMGLADTAELPDPVEATDEAGPGAGMLAALLRQAMAPGDDAGVQAMGLDEGGVFGVYAVDGLPVLRYRLDDADGFRAAVAEAEAQAGVEAAAGTEEDRWRYPFDAPAGATPPALVVGIHGGYAVLTLAVPGMEEALASALGEEPPEPSLAETERLAGLAETHGTLSWATGYIDHTAVAAAVTGHGDSGTGRLIRALADIYEGELPEVSEACARDLDSIIAGAPRSVIGAVELDAKTGRAHSRWVTEIADHGLITTLQRLRGHIPAAVDGGVAHLGIGLDMAELVPVLQALVERFRAAEWECPELRELQEQTDPQQLAGLGMFTAMLADVRGMNATLLEVPGGEGMPPAVVDVATGRPQSLWQVAQGFLGATSQPEMGGGPVPLAHPMLPDGALRVALREGRFTILAGEGTSLPEVTDADLSPNGVLSLRYNLAELGEGLPEESAALAAGAGEGMPDAEELEEIREQLRAVNVDQTIDLDIGEHGIRLDVTATPGSER